jgi:hypothetical protein
MVVVVVVGFVAGSLVELTLPPSLLLVASRGDEERIFVARTQLVSVAGGCGGVCGFSFGLVFGCGWGFLGFLRARHVTSRLIIVLRAITAVHHRV